MATKLLTCPDCGASIRPRNDRVFKRLRVVAGAFREAKQRASETIDRQGSTLETMEIERNYFENLAKKKPK